MRRLLLTLFILGIGAAWASADCEGSYTIDYRSVTGMQWVSDYRNTQEPGCNALAIVYLHGMIAADDEEIYAIPVNATGDQTAAVILKWATNNPEHLHNPAIAVVRRALASVWPKAEGDLNLETSAQY